KTRCGLDVVTVSTATTGASTEGIKSWLQTAWDTWPVPPAYVLLVGDIGAIPTFSFYGNPSDQPYIQLDGDDWLPDAAIGRFPVENVTEAETMVAKTIAYERQPGLAASAGWQTRSLMVAGVYASDTPGYTVDFCGGRLVDMGFPAPTTVSSPPLPSLQGANAVRATLNTGVGMVVYRGWAYGTAGWDPPTFTVDDIPSLATNAMTPVVMSFVCLNGDYTNSSPCFGEVFVRQGTPAAPGKGAVAFIGNGEHWSHTRYNDAMAIGMFERIVDPELTALGPLLNAAKLRFADYFPNEVAAAEYGEESVEFYFHIYNLLGDPALGFWRDEPRAATVTHPVSVAVGTTALGVAVVDGGALPVAGARVAVVQDGVLLGTGLTGADGAVRVVLDAVTGAGDVAVVVTGADLVPYEGVATTGVAAVNLGATAVAVADGGSDGGTGNGDLVANPGETLDLTVTVRNHGSVASGAFSLGLTVDGPAAVAVGAVAVGDIAAGATLDSPTPLQVAVAPEAADGAVLTLDFDATRAGDQHDLSALELVVAAPAWEILGLGAADGAWPTAGATTDLALTLRNTGSVAAAGGTVALALTNPTGAVLGTATAALPACAPGATVTTAAVFDVTVDPATAAGTQLNFDLTVTTAAGARTVTTCASLVGPIDVGAPVGPDAYGYYAYDSADYDYPASRPRYEWTEISTALGGPGTKLDFPVENEVVWMVVDLPFTFRYYGQDYTQCRVSDNGWISFDTGTDYDFYNWTIPTQYGVEALVAPFWDNLNPQAPASPEDNVNGLAPDGIYTWHDAAAGAFVVEWSRLPHYKPEILGLQTFQLRLLDPAQHPTTGGDGEMLFLYRQVTNNDYLRMYATVGIESPDGEDGIQLSYGNINSPGMAPLQPGLAVRITTERPVRVPFALASFAATSAGGGVELRWQPGDERPVTGWRVLHSRDGTTTDLTPDPLPAAARSFTVRGATDDADATWILQALQPYGATTEAGRARTVVTAPLALQPAWPNPAGGDVTFGFALPRAGHARLRVYDVAGRLVRTLIDGDVVAGAGARVWDGRADDGHPVAGGVYFFRLESPDGARTRKMILVR
ncbi:hypothetical protein KDM41_12815, partial [bacterium]|nr:hypothetical protein [bacterium]